MGSQCILTRTRIQRKMARTRGSTSTCKSTRVMISLTAAYTETDTAHAPREMVVVIVTMEMR
jgi:hypothetical protein